MMRDRVNKSRMHRRRHFAAVFRLIVILRRTGHAVATFDGLIRCAHLHTVSQIRAQGQREGDSQKCSSNWHSLFNIKRGSPTGQGQPNISRPVREYAEKLNDRLV